MELILITLGFFAVCMGAMAVGVLVSGRKLSGSCGSPEDHDRLDVSCGVCVKQENDLCPTSEENGDLVRLSTLGNPNRP